MNRRFIKIKQEGNPKRGRWKKEAKTKWLALYFRFPDFLVFYYKSKVFNADLVV